jgi:transcription-repair coupling factor (superfamily II helicase)
VGFKVALKDLEIRGAGNLLGPEQHGFIVGLGFDLYVKLLEEAVAEIKGEAAEVEARAAAAHRLERVPARRLRARRAREAGALPPARGHARASLLDDLTLEMLDRFGQLPPPAIALVELRRLRLLGGEAGSRACACSKTSPR